jgi:hypothetical protein
VKDKSFGKYVASADISLETKQQTITRLVQWMILNFNRFKVKTSPGGSRNAQLSTNIE